jgi:c-di-GMP-binding flagellar brake protein YcgR
MGVGLWRDIDRFRQWRSVRKDHDSEIVLGDRAMQIGQMAILTAANRANCPRFDGTLVTHVESIGLHSIRLLVASGGEEDQLWPPVGATVRVTFPSSDALYRCSLLVSGHKPPSEESDFRRLTVSRPAWLARVQRRKHFRMPIRMRAGIERVTMLTSVGERLLRQTASAEELPPRRWQFDLINISAGGVLGTIPCGPDAEGETFEAVEPGALVRVSLAIPGLAETPLVARILTRKSINGTEGASIRLACEFMPMASWEQDLLVQFIFSAQRKTLQATDEESELTPTSRQDTAGSRSHT